MKRHAESAGSSDEEDVSMPKRAAIGGKGGSKKGGGHKSGDKSGKNGGLGVLRQHVFKVLCPDSFAANIIGPQGTTRAGIEETTGCSMWVSKRDEFYPDSRCRILIVHGDDVAQVYSALELMVPKLIEAANKERDRNAEDPSCPLVGKEEGEFIFRLALPTMIRGKFIGTRGANIKKLREHTGAKIFVENEVYDGHQLTRIIGVPEKICHALRMVNEEVQEVADDEEFAAWAAIQDFPSDIVPHRLGKGGDRDYGEKGRGKDSHGGESHGRGGGGRDWNGDRSRSRGESYGGQGQRYPVAGSALEILQSTSDQFPIGAQERDHAIRCDLPKSRVAELVGTRGDYVAYVERTSGAKVTFEESGPEGNADFRTVMVTGPLIPAYMAHMMLMRRYHEKEREREQAAVAAATQHSGGFSSTDEAVARVDSLQSQILALESQLHDVRGGLAGGRFGGKGRM
eukprot:TRINITY_DN3168_c0_g1_i3.p1 TRINITY_DN3168_c0_g1~~TRINITY_DN3168_c0_g1_i3.p1  ORF type:complete len:456 (-),score=96.31 TRINITY_DN3168_c0_g1_i3:197-1564(-)